jgi:hypothetical protein
MTNSNLPSNTGKYSINSGKSGGNVVYQKYSINQFNARVTEIILVTVFYLLTNLDPMEKRI